MIRTLIITSKALNEEERHLIDIPTDIIGKPEKEIVKLYLNRSDSSYVEKYISCWTDNSYIYSDSESSSLWYFSINKPDFSKEVKDI